MTDREVILDATLSILRDRGFAGVNMEDIAARANVDPIALYSQWRSRSELVVELLRELAETPSEIPDSGEFRGDLVVVIERLVEVVHRLGAVAASVMDQAARDPELDRELRLFVFSWQGPLRQLVRRGVERGELPRGVNEDTAIDLATSIVWFRRMLLSDRTRLGLPERIADPILRAWGYDRDR